MLRVNLFRCRLDAAEGQASIRGDRIAGALAWPSDEHFS